MRVCRCRLVVGVLLLVGLSVLLVSHSSLHRHFLTSELPAVMQERRDEIWAACEGPGPQDSLTASALRADTALQGYQMLSSNPRLTSHLVVDDVQKALYCYVPKVACTNWKRLMMILSGTSNETNPNMIPPDSVHRQHALTMLNTLQPEEIVKRLQTYTKFMVARDPLERTLSAFRNKFEKNYASSAYFKSRFGVKIQKMYRDKEAVSQTGDGTTFAEFVRYLVTTTTRGEIFNEHWAPMVHLCQPCLVRYDMIGKYESINTDSATILQWLGAPAHLALPTVKYSKTASLLHSYLATLQLETKLQLQQLFAEDILLFGYAYRDDSHY